MSGRSFARFCSVQAPRVIGVRLTGALDGWSSAKVFHMFSSRVRMYVCVTWFFSLRTLS